METVDIKALTKSKILVVTHVERFLTAYRAAIKTDLINPGLPENYKHQGLCISNVWFDHKRRGVGLSDFELSADDTTAFGASNLLRSMLFMAGYQNPGHPFCNLLEYREECKNGTLHLNPKRMAFVDFGIDLLRGELSALTVEEYTIQFLRHYLLSAMSFNPHDRWVTENAHGLCPNLISFARNLGMRTSLGAEAYQLLKQRLKREFGETGSIAPFGGIELYNQQSRSKTQHQNQQRLDWARKYLNELVAA